MTYTLLLRTQHGWTDFSHGQLLRFETYEEAFDAGTELCVNLLHFKVVRTEDLGNYDLIA